MNDDYRLKTWSARERSRYLKELTETTYDMLIIGGGITGAGVLRACGLSGINAALIEKEDFAFGTSSKSTRLAHGGARYIAMMELEAPDIIPLGERFGFYRDIGTKMGMTPIRAWELPIARRRWLTITAVAYPTLTLYEAHYY